MGLAGVPEAFAITTISPSLSPRLRPRPNPGFRPRLKLVPLINRRLILGLSWRYVV